MGKGAKMGMNLPVPPQWRAWAYPQLLRQEPAPPRSPAHRATLRATLSLFAAAWTVVMVLGGCGGSPPPKNEGPSGAHAESHNATFALVTLRSSEVSGPKSMHYQLHSSAYFVRHTGIDRRSTAKLLGDLDYADFRLPTELEYSDFSEFEAGQCAVHSRSSARELPADDGSVELELLDLGRAWVTLPNTLLELRARQVPDFLGFVGGVTYASTARRKRLPFRSDQDTVARFNVEGDLDIAGFSVDLEVPNPVWLVSVNGRSADAGEVSAERERPIDVKWEPVGGPSNLLVVELRRTSFNGMTALRCLVEDTGAFTIPEEALRQLPELPGGSTDKLQVSRMTMQSFRSEGIDDGLVVFVAEDSVLLREEP